MYGEEAVRYIDCNHLLKENELSVTATPVIEDEKLIGLVALHIYFDECKVLEYENLMTL